MTQRAVADMAKVGAEQTGQLPRGSEAGYLTKGSIRRKPVGPLLIYRTLRPLRFSQLGYLVMRRVFRRRSPAVKLGTPVGLRHVSEDWPFPEDAAAKNMLATREFTFLNQTVRCHRAIPRSTTEREFEIPDSEGRSAIPWDDRRYPKLWLYHLNYCDFLNARFALPEEEGLLNAAVDIALDWLQQNARGTEVGWEPYALSVRIVNWVKFLVRHGRRVELLRGAATLSALLESLGNQAATLERRLEKDLLGNHLLKNIKALLFAGAILETSRSSRWWAEGEKLLQRELDEQILPDGGHFERSPMYHSQVLADLAEIRLLCRATGRRLVCSRLLSEKIGAMARFLRGVLHPDGEIPLFNDSALGGARPPAESLAMAESPDAKVIESESPVTVFPDTGYGVIRSAESRSALIFDCGPVGPDYQPGHGHCDLLSYELSLEGQRVVVDAGASTYEPGQERSYERSTAAHNTIRIDREEQAEMWASFRVGRRPQAGGIRGGAHGGFPFVSGEHDAYRRLGVIHARTIVLHAPYTWIVADLLKGSGSHLVESFLHFHPRVRVEGCPDCMETSTGLPLRRWTVILGDQSYWLATYGPGQFDLHQSWYSERFGNRQPSTVLSWAWRGPIPAGMIHIFTPMGASLPHIAADWPGNSIEIAGAKIPLR